MKSISSALLLPSKTQFFVQVGHSRNSQCDQAKSPDLLRLPPRQTLCVALLLCICISLALVGSATRTQSESSKMATASAFSSSRVASRPTAAPKCAPALPGRRQAVCRAQQVCDLGGGQGWSRGSLLLKPQLLPSSGTPACSRPGSVNLHPAAVLQALLPVCPFAPAPRQTTAADLTKRAAAGAAALTLSLGSLSAPAIATEFDILGEETPKAYFVDDASVLSKSTKADLNKRLSILEV